MVSKLCQFLTVCLALRFMECVSDDSSNVAFVIDDTASMTPVINQVTDQVENIFKYIYTSKTSVIGDFILITFNDVEIFENDNNFNDFSREAIILRSKTKDPKVFLTALDEIQAKGGGFGRQELSLRGIQMAINKCNPNSYIYVFTDERPRDYYLEDTIIYLAQNKSIQITFLLTARKSIDDSVYKRIANATSGEVFLINEHDVEQILEYIKVRMRNPGTTLITVTNQPGKSNISVTADKDMTDLSVMTHGPIGSNLDLEIIGPDGKKPPTFTIVDTPNTKCVIVQKPQNGSYIATINSDGTSETSVKAAVSVDFRVGFNTWNTNSVTNTKIKPVPDEESYLLIQLILTGTTNATLKNITILNMDETVLTRLSANVINETEKLYVTTFKPPNQTFKIGIEAMDIATDEPLKRVYRSPIEPRITGPLEYKRPQVTIENSPKIVAKYGDTIKLVCNVNAYPKPNITWEDEETGLELPSTESILELPYERMSHLEIKQITKDGSYKCKAISSQNEIISASIQVETFREKYLKTLESPKGIPAVVVNQRVTAKIGDKVTLSCEASGEPTPDIKWIKDGKTITTDKKFEIFNNHSLRFVTNFVNGGNYTCAAKNYLGEDSKNTSVVIRDPVKIEPPEPNTYIVPVRTNLVLPCKASGLPKPMVIWKFIPSDPNSEPPSFRKMKSTLNIPEINYMNDGKYKCIAENEFDKEEITYVVNVRDPVKIEGLLQTEFTVVKNDHVLRIPCKAKGFPKPTFIWMKKYRVIKMDDSYKQDSDGALIINNPDTSLPRTEKYICIANNNITLDSKIFTVEFTLTPNPSEPIETIYILEGASPEIDCKLPHKSTDTIRWYKEGEIIYLIRNEFILWKARISDTARYTCRVSSSQGAQSATYNIIVGTKPEFENKKNESIVAFTAGYKTYLNCYVKGTPTPTVTWWQNGRKLIDAPTFYEIPELNESHLGEFRCEAKNAFGTITQTYIIKVTGCPIDYTKNETNKFHPILLLDWKLAEYQNEEGKMIVSDYDEIQFVCPDNVQKLQCSKNKFSFVDNPSQHVTYDDLKCTKEVIPSIRQLSNREYGCIDGSRIQVGYKYKNTFFEVYEVCINQIAQKRYFTKHYVSQFASNIKINSHPFISQYMNYNYDEMYDCSKQNNMGKEGCCFLGRQLVSPQDVSPAIQKSTYYNMNVSPQWNFCGYNANINEVERRIRAFAKSLKSQKLEVFSGEYEDQSRFLLSDRHGNRKIVPKYLWKVVQILKNQMALAIITINVPNLTEEEANELMFCDDLCDVTGWMSNPEWHNVSRGFTFCCDPWDFADKINPYYVNLFPGNLLIERQNIN